MNEYFSLSISKGLEKHGLPMLKINLLRTLGFDVIIDMSIRDNLIDPNFIYFEVDEDFYTCMDEDVDSSLKPKMYLFNDFFRKLEVHTIIRKDGVKQRADKIEFTFKLQGESYTDIFSVIKLQASLYRLKDVNIDVVLGSDFILKHKWSIDYNKKAVLIPKCSLLAPI